MIFSHDKAPTRPGWYWYKPVNGAIKPKQAVLSTKSGRLGCYGYGFTPVAEMVGEWGDEIPTPTLEGAQE